MLHSRRCPIVLVFFLLTASGSALVEAQLFLSARDLRRSHWGADLPPIYARWRETGEMRNMLGKLGEARPRWDCNTCAVVGGASSVWREELGAEIDSHDCVFRANRAPTEGYEKYVGTKRTVHFGTMPRAVGFQSRDPKGAFQLRVHLLEFANRTENVTVLALSGQSHVDVLLEMIADELVPKERVRVLHPFQTAEVCRSVGCEFVEDGFKRRPSTGLLMVNVAAHMCATPPLVVGFDAYSVPFHYYDLPGGTLCTEVRNGLFATPVHDFPREQQVLELWHEKGRIRFRLPVGGFSAPPDLMACKDYAKLEVVSGALQLAGEYQLQHYAINKNLVYQRAPTEQDAATMVLFLTHCMDGGSTVYYWVILPHEFLAAAVAQMGMDSVSVCDAFAHSRDFRPEFPEAGRWWAPFADGTERADVMEIRIPEDAASG